MKLLVTDMANGTFSFVVLVIYISLRIISPVKEFETGSKHERMFIDHREKGFTSEDHRVVVTSWLKKWLAGTLVLTGNDLDTQRSKHKQCRWKRTVKTG